MILVVDDQSYSDLYWTELEKRNLLFSRFSNVDDAWEFVLSCASTIDLAILDVFMKPGHLFSLKETDDGFTTGVHFAKILRRRHGACFIYLLTNIDDPSVGAFCRSTPRAIVRRKTHMYPNEFGDEIAEIYARILRQRGAGT